MSYLEQYLVEFKYAYPIEFNLKDILQDVVEHNHEGLREEAQEKLKELELSGKN